MFPFHRQRRASREIILGVADSRLVTRSVAAITTFVVLLCLPAAASAGGMFGTLPAEHLGRSERGAGERLFELAGSFGRQPQDPPRRLPVGRVEPRRR